jgi:hypothetical protein
MKPIEMSIQEPARLVTDSNGLLADANLEACLMLDMGRRALIGKRLATFVDRADLARLDRLLGGLSAGQKVEMRLRMRDRVGRLKMVQMHGAIPPRGTQVAWKVRPLILAA